MKKSVRASLRKFKSDPHRERQILNRQVRHVYFPQKQGPSFLMQLFYGWLICMGVGAVLSLIMLVLFSR